MMKGKKILSLVLAVLFLLPGLGVGLTASAQDAVTFSVVPDETTAHPGETITYAVHMGPVSNLNGLQITLGLPDGLTFKQANLKTKLLQQMRANCPEFSIDFVDSTLTLFIYTISPSDQFTSTADGVLMTFTCTVDEGASGAKTIDLPKHTVSSRTGGGTVPTAYDPAGSAVTIMPAPPVKAIELVTGGAAANIAGAQKSSVYFGNYKQSSNGSGGFNVDPVKWRVLSNADGKLFLLSDQNLDAGVYYERYFTVTWETSTIRAWLNGAGEFSEENFKDSAFSAGEDAAVCVTDVSNPDSVFDDRTVPGGNDTADKVFLLSRDEAMNTAYGFTNDIEPTDTRVSINTAYTGSGGSNYGWTGEGGSADYWWLRSPGSADDRAAIVFETGQLNPGGYDVPNRSIAVRPAMNVDLGKVLFTSPAVGGKQGDGLTAVGNYNYYGSEWKLTLLDDSRQFAVTQTASGGSATVTNGYNTGSVTGGTDVQSQPAVTTAPGKTVSFSYNGATVGENEYVSAILTDEDGAALYYGRLAQPTDEEGTVTVTIPADLAAGDYTLMLFSEQCNGDKMTDLASAPINVALTVKARVPGDANRDGQLDMADVLAILYYYVRIGEPEIDVQDADVNGNSEIDVGDAEMIQEYLAGQIDSLNGQKPDRPTGNNHTAENPEVTCAFTDADGSSEVTVNAGEKTTIPVTLRLYGSNIKLYALDMQFKCSDGIRITGFIEEEEGIYEKAHVVTNDSTLRANAFTTRGINVTQGPKTFKLMVEVPADATAGSTYTVDFDDLCQVFKFNKKGARELFTTAVTPLTISVKADPSKKAIRLVPNGSADYILGAQKSNVWFGNYRQSSADSKEPVKWRVLSNADGKLLLLADQNLDVVRYNEEGTSVTWATCTLRAWLNGYDGNPYSDSFIGSAFSDKETAAIAQTAVVNDTNPSNNTPGGNDTADKVFLLSIAEAKNTAYGFTDNYDSTDSRVSKNTAYVASGGHTGHQYMNEVGKAELWWLRSPGSLDSFSSIVDDNGSLDDIGREAYEPIVAVRPALNVDLNKVLFISPAENGKPTEISFNAENKPIMSAVSDYNGSDWKLTVLDESRSNFTVRCVSFKDGICRVRYTNTKSTSNDVISGMIVDADGNVKYYGILGYANPFPTAFPFDVSGQYEVGDRIYIFNEEIHYEEDIYGNYKTDCSSALIDITPEKLPEGLTAAVGRTLADVTLNNPDGNTDGTWTWDDPSTPVDSEGEHSFAATFTPDDTSNFDTVHTSLTVKVEAAAPPKAINLVTNGEAETIKGAQQSNIWFGNYRQSGSKEDGWNNDPIKWRVLSNANGKLFLLADQNLDVMQYNKERTEVTWEECTLRKWLNGYENHPYDDTFIDNAFTAAELTAVAESELENADNPEYDTSGGNDTTDKVFLLSIAEAKNTAYGFTDDGTRVSTNTAYVTAGGHAGGGKNRVGEPDYWWLRSPGLDSTSAARVSDVGSVRNSGYDVYLGSDVVRPAFNLDLNSVLFTSAAENGKVGSGLTAVGSYTGTEWKLTVLDESRSGFTAKCTNIENGNYTITYSGAVTGENEMISAVIVDENGVVTYYGVLCDAAEGKNTLTLDVNGKLNDGDTLYVFNEQVNGDKKTDYASALVDVTEKTLTSYDLWVGETEVTENCTSGEGWEYAPATNTLTLNDYEYEGVGQSFSDTWNNSNVTFPAASAICYLGSEPLHLVIEGKNTVVQTGAVDTSVGIFCASTLEISGTGELNVTAGAARSFSFGIECAETLSITGGKINAFGGSAITSAGISASRFSMENGEVYAVGADARRQSYGIFYAPDKPDAFCSVSGGKLTCRGGKADATSSGLDSSGSVTFSGGEIDLAGGEANISCGLYVERRHTLITVSASVNRVVCTGNSRAFFTNCDLKNETDAGAWKNTSGTGEIFTIPAHTEAVDAVEFIHYKRIEFPSSVYSVTVTAGAGMAKASGDASQTVDKGGSMNSVVYTANDGYYFPTDYAVEAVNGVSVTRDSFTQITVSGTPTGDAAITLPAATAKTTPDMTVTAPTVTYGQNAVITATLPDDATGSVIFSLVGSKNTYTFTDSSITDGVAQVSQKLNADAYTVTATYSGDGKYDGAEKTITFTVEKAATELAIATSPDKLVYGDAVQITVTLSGGAVFAGDQIDPGTGEPAKAPGSVTITVDGKEYSTISTDPDDVTIVIRDNTATLEVTGLNAGQHTIDAVFVASDNYAGSSQTATFDIGKATPQITLTAKSLNDAATAYEITVTKPADSTQGVMVYAVYSGLPALALSIRNDKFENGSYTFRFPDVFEDYLSDNVSGEFELSAVYDGRNDQNYQDNIVKLAITLGCAHVWNTPTWDWTDVDNPTYTAECSLCETGKITGTVASTPGTRVEATVEKNAYTPYSASVELSGHTYTGTFDLEEPGTMLAARKTAFDAYKAAQKQAADQLAQPNDSAACAALIEAAKTAIDGVTYNEAKELQDNKDAVDAAANLPQLEEKLTDQRAADAVILAIEAIGTVEFTPECEAKVNSARAAYNALTDAQQALVTNYDKLIAAEAAYALLADKAAFEQYKDDLKQAAEDMRKDDDSAESKKLIDDTVADIEALEYDESKPLDQNKQAVDTAANLPQLEEKLTDQRAADEVEKKINDIGDVAYTDESKDKIDEARKAYDDLTDKQKALVDNKDTLEKAEDDYQLLDDKNSFEEYKDELKQAAEDMRTDDDSEESKKLIDDTVDAIEAMEYDESKSLDQNKQTVDDAAKLDELTEQLEEHRAVYYAVFKADGVEIARVPYTIDTKSIDEPAVPVKDNYTGAWSKYELKAGGVEINAVYTKNDALVITDNAKEQGEDRVLTFMETVTFTTDTSALPEGATLCWYVNGEAVTADKSVTVESPKDDYTVQVRAFAKDGTLYAESDVLAVKVDHSFWAKLVCFFKLAFNPVFNALKKVVPSFFSFLVALIKAIATAIVAVVKSVI